MSDTFIIRGVPRRLAQDGWWLAGTEASATPQGTNDDPGHTATGHARRWIGLALLIILADLLFWHHAVGLSLALFAGAIFAVATMDVRPRRVLAGPAGLLALGALPIVDFVQVLSLAFLAAALAGALAWARHPGASVAERLADGVALIGRLPGDWLSALSLPLRATRQARAPEAAFPAGTATLRTILRNWTLPLGGTLVFAALLLQANPVLARLLSLRLDVAQLAERGLFWAGIALICWPLVDPEQPRRLATPNLPAHPRVPGLNAGSALRALVLFNLVIGVQTGMDLTIFVGGASLPDGMNYAAYAHRGAYPLLAAALLAGAFALAARPFVGEHRALKPLMLVWLGQNVALCFSALLRLDLYIDAYGLTYLRVRALIWMALVAAGLALTGWQVARGCSNRWLVTRIATLGVATLYAAAFVNFAGVIAAHNLAMPNRSLGYLCTLGPTATAALAEAEAGDPGLATALNGYRCNLRPPVIEGWRDWGFRNWRVARYVAHMKASEPPG